MGGDAPLLPDAVSFAAVLPPFLALAFGAWRGRFLGFGRWTARLFAISAVLLILIVIDATLVLVAGFTVGFAASAAMLVTGAAWILGRQAVLEHFSISKRHSQRR